MKKQIKAGGVTIVAVTYAMWGFLILFWNLLSEISPLYILAMRVFFSAVLTGILAVCTGKKDEIKQAFSSKKSIFQNLGCSILLVANWGIYIYAVNCGHVLDASLGYFIEPVLVGLIGFILFRERPSALEAVTYVLAFAGLIFMFVRTGAAPWLPLVIAGTFAVYGAIKKHREMSPVGSLFCETVFMAPIALGFAVFCEIRGSGVLGTVSAAKLLLLPLCGVVTAVPLMMFNNGVKKIPYYLSGILMYINPTIGFLLGLFHSHEALDRNRLIAFIIIWAGILFSIVNGIMQIVSGSRNREESA